MTKREKMRKVDLCFLKTPQDSKICDEKTSEAVQGAAAAGFFSKSLLCKPCAEIRLRCLSHKRGAAIKDLSRKAESLAALLLVALAVGGCTTTKREAVYIPTKCKTKSIPKPTPSKDSSISQDVAEILQYTELLERDLEFCKGE